MGEPGDVETRQWRARAHEAFDPIWSAGSMSREAAYGWLRTVLFLPRERAHISMLTKEQCVKLIDLALKYRSKK